MKAIDVQQRILDFADARLRGSNRKSKIVNRKSKIVNRKSKIVNRKSKIVNRKFYRLHLLTLLISALLLVNCQGIPSQTATPTPEPPSLVDGTDGMPWWNDTVFYEVFVRSFYDSNDDGIGDINGLIEKLDYLNDGDPNTIDDLGITGIWLMPIMESPSYHGYDVTDYYQVDDEYGTNEDFKRLVAEAHARGIRVIVDMVLNHTSNQHPWFQEAIDPSSQRRDWYIWSDTHPGYIGPWGQQVWYPFGDAFYYAVFWEGMPDLNYENPAVTEEMLKAVSFWLEEMGADGFRLDAIKHLVENGQVQENTDSTHEWLQDFYTFYKDVDGETIAVGEAWTTTLEVLDYIGDEVDLAFQFDLAQAFLNSTRSGAAGQVRQTQEQTVESFPPGQYATFLTNHDQDRVMSHLLGDEQKARVVATLLLTSPGVPFIYYGEEIGLQGRKPDENIRRPMQWSGETPGAGFTTGTPWRSPEDDYAERNVALQNDDPASLLNHYQALIRLRNQHEALRIGEWLAVETNSRQVYAYLRASDDETILVLANLGRQPEAEYSLDLAKGPLTGAVEVVPLLGEADPAALAANETGGFAGYRPLAELPAYSTFVFQLAAE